MDNNLHQRKSIRLQNYDYSQAGYYFITICAKDRKPLFGEIKDINSIDTDMVGVDAHSDPSLTTSLSQSGELINTYIQNIDTVYHNVHLDLYIIMPNHIHMIVIIDDNNYSSITLPKVINSLKTITTKKCGYPVWQRKFYEHIIRNEIELNEIREYIINNPYKWSEDKYYSDVYT